MASPVSVLPAPQEAELALSVERAYREAVLLDRLGGLWALILAKCCLAQWAILRFAIPVSGALYVWGLTLVMAALASGFYLHAHRVGLRLLPTQFRVGSAAFVGVAVGVGFVLHAHFALGLLAVAATAGLIAALVGVWSLIRAALRLAWEPLLGALLWWACAGTALRSREHDALLWLGLGFLFAQSLPSFALAARTRRRHRV